MDQHFKLCIFLPKELHKVLTATLLFLVSIISHFFLSLFCNHQLVKRFCLCSLSLGNHQSLSSIFHALHRLLSTVFSNTVLKLHWSYAVALVQWLKEETHSQMVELESQQWILDGHIFLLIGFKIGIDVCLKKTENKRKTGRGWSI